MTGAEALEAIRRMVRGGQVVFTRHAWIRMDERGASANDVCKALVTAKAAAHEPKLDRWKVAGGADLDGEPLVVVVAIEADVIIVTLF